MKHYSCLKAGVAALWLISANSHATGVVPETSVVIVEQADGEGAINVKNTDELPVLLVTTLIDTADDAEALLIVTPPAARLEPGKIQRVRLILTGPPGATERLKRVTFDGIAPQQKGQNEVRTTVRQNLPVIIRPAGLERDYAPWKRLTWTLNGNQLSVSNPSPYVVRLSQAIETLPGNTPWTLPNAYVLPGQTVTVAADGDQPPGPATQVRLSPATTWGYSVDIHDADLSQ